jgi:hypothetical protein
MYSEFFMSSISLATVYFINNYLGLILAVVAVVLIFIILIMNKIRYERNKDLSLMESIEKAGYLYDEPQDIFYSTLDAWQKKYGYCQLYDEASAPLSMIVDCEPIYFEYDDKDWLIEFWKGQYGITTGCEVGVYNSSGLNLNIPGIFNGKFFKAADEEDQLEISYDLIKNKNILFEREGKHWWLTGFRLGEFSETYELSMNIKITLKDSLMCTIFVEALKDKGYKDHELRVKNNTVWFVFDKPYSQQPISRTESIEWAMQTKNQILCEQYLDITKGHINIVDKLNAIKKSAPEIYYLILHMGKSEQIFKGYDLIEDYIK